MGIPIEKLELSMRANNVLHGLLIDTAEQLKTVPLGIIERHHNAGKLTMDEIRSAQERLLSGEINLAELAAPVKYGKRKEYDAEQLAEMSHHTIGELGLSQRPFSLLIQGNCVMLDHLATLSYGDLDEFEGMGSKSKEEILKKMSAWVEKNDLIEDPDDKGPNIGAKEFFAKAAEALEPIGHFYWRHLYRCAKDAGIVKRIAHGGYRELNEHKMKLLLDLPEVSEKLPEFYMRIAHEGVIRVDELRTSLEKTQIPVDTVLEMLLADTCDRYDDFLYAKRMSFKEFFDWKDNGLSERSRDIFAQRVNGKNLEEISQCYTCSREWVRQILIKVAADASPVFEDYLREPFEYFHFTRNDFVDCFPELGPYGYMFLSIRYDEGDHLFSEEELQAYKGPFREKLSGFVKRYSIRKDQQTVTRTQMIYRVLLDHLDHPMSVEEFQHAYVCYVKDHGFPMERLHINIHTVLNHMRNSRHIVFNRDNKMRYCEVDVDRLWDEVDFTQYRDLVLSGERIHKDYPDLMEELDIRDGYELFYVIKSSIGHWKGDFKINCRRVPVMVFGNGDEKDQAIQLLNEVSPISFMDFYAAYQERFGVRKDTAQANLRISKAISQYYTGGQYSIDVPDLDPRDVERLEKAVQQKPFWFSEELEDLFAKECPNSPKGSLNRPVLNRAGYILNSGYAYDNRYDTISDYLDHYIFKDDIVDLSKLDRRYMRLSTFSAVMERKKRSLEFIEVNHNILYPISRFKEEYGIDEVEIRAYQDRVLSKCKEDYFNADSLWRSIISRDPLANRTRKNKWLLTCLLRQKEDIFSLPVRGGIILSREREKLSLSKVCVWIAERNGKMSLEDLTDNFNRIFGTELSKEKISIKLKTAGIWEDVVTDPMYADVNWEELEEEFEGKNPKKKQ